MKNILVVCIGNICRSPTAEALLKQQLPDQMVWSAGLGAVVGHPADPLAIEVAEEHGLDMSEHRGQQLAGWMCQRADLILVMEQSHKVEIERQYPLVRGKVFRLGEIGKFDIADPYREPKEKFVLAFENIARGVSDWVPRIRQLAA